ncbi:hypothetical protein CHS0354_012535 [Potamilus streckersoni]|uniref:G-protein coupled receptors family 3 profile domain-containing protein n=1 Tax=Potamilus streckersoni TaxID=2493646 RepID=A0AAE0SVN0_9BIVA|nr:hypothetical protein CHS0354_012535 [Potamilus streckersoni]
MDAYLVLVRLTCILIMIMDLIIYTKVDCIGLSDLKFPPKFTHYSLMFYSDKLKTSSKYVRQVRSQTNLPSSGTRDDFGRLSKIFEFILKANLSDCKGNTITLKEFKYEFPTRIFSNFNEQAKEGVFIANTLTTLFRHDPSLEISRIHDAHIQIIASLIRNTIESDKLLAGGGIYFQNGFFLYVSGTASGLSNATEVAQFFKNETFYLVHKEKDYTKLLTERSNNTVQLNDSNPGSLIVNVGEARVSLSISEDVGYWSQPYFECLKLKRWVTSVSFPFFFQDGQRIEVKGVVRLDIDLERIDVNQCDNSNTLFGNSHKCQQETTECIPEDGKGLKSGSYRCRCRRGFFFPIVNATRKYYVGTELESVFMRENDGGKNVEGNLSGNSEYQCLPCRQGCDDCIDNTPCFVEYNILTRGIPLGIQSFCMTITLVLGIVVLRFRKRKVMVISMWILLEITLLGALFLYATVVIQYFEPSTTTCLIVPWLREVGFSILYGALTLKIYRLLADFQSRKAHRVHVRDKDLLKYLLCIVAVVTGYMAAWTAVNLDHVRDGKSIVDIGQTYGDEGLKYFICKAGWWDYATEVAELLFLCFGIHMCYRVRAAPSDFSEGTYVSAAICIECSVSTVFYILRHVYWLGLHPDYLFLMHFVRCQTSVSLTLILIFGPKLWYAHLPPDDIHMRNRAYSSSDVPDNTAPETLKLNVGISSNGDVDVGDVSLADMDPEDIRAELKRLYTQLQIYKTRNMRKDNPHISKRRGGRKQTHRRFSLQAFHHKHRHHHDHDHEHELSKTPEESTNSAEGFAMPMESTSSKVEEVHEGKPITVSFKMGHSYK